MQVRLYMGDGAKNHNRKYAERLCNENGLCDQRYYNNTEDLFNEGSYLYGFAKSFDGKYDFEFWINDKGMCNFKNKGDDDSQQYQLQYVGETHYWTLNGISLAWYWASNGLYMGMLDKE